MLVTHIRVAGLLLVICWAVLSSGCNTQPSEVRATVVYFSEQEPGTDVYRTRMLVTERFLRIDDGHDGQDFLLFDLQQRMIFNASSQDKTILVIEPQPLKVQSPLELVNRTIKSDEKVPAVGKYPVTSYRYFTNGEQCYEVYAAKDLLVPVVDMLREYRQSLAGEQAAVLALMPAAMQSGCDLANNIFVPGRHLEHGFPVRQQDMLGRWRELLDYKIDVKVDSNLFKLPVGFRRYSPADMRGG